jgi:hypothetical protein
MFFVFSSVYWRTAPSMITLTVHSVCPAAPRLRLALVFGDARREQFHLDAGFRHAMRLQRLRHRLHHAVGTADESGRCRPRRPSAEQRVGLRTIDAAIQDLDVLRLLLMT